MADTETIEIQQPEEKKEPAKPPTRDELKAGGWSVREMDAAEKHGMVSKPDEKSPAKEEEKPKEAQVQEPKADAKPPQAVASLPDFTMAPDKEKVFTDSFGPGTTARGLYFRMKNERQARQAAEAERDRITAEKKALEVQLEALKAAPPEKEVDENGNVISQEDKPLTLRQLEEREKQKAEEFSKQQAEFNERASRVTQAQKDQEEYARSLFQDFDDTVKRATAVIQNLDALVPEHWKQEKVLRLVRDLQVAAARADQIGVDDYNAALIAYEIGQFHPEHGKPGNGSEPKKTGPEAGPKADGGLTPEQMKRVEENTQRRASSASIPAGGGKRTVTPEEVTLADIVGMTAAQRLNFREKHPERYAKLLRG